MISFTLRFYSTVYSWNREVIATGAEQTTFLDASAACELIAVIMDDRDEVFSIFLLYSQWVPL